MGFGSDRKMGVKIFGLDDIFYAKRNFVNWQWLKI
jgi:hypothetical protein